MFLDWLTAINDHNQAGKIMVLFSDLVLLQYSSTIGVRKYFLNIHGDIPGIKTGFRTAL